MTFSFRYLNIYINVYVWRCMYVFVCTYTNISDRDIPHFTLLTFAFLKVNSILYLMLVNIEVQCIIPFSFSKSFLELFL